ncbi:MAG: hypothetical protein WCE80_08440 [Acidimicrobiia bacterium]
MRWPRAETLLLVLILTACSGEKADPVASIPPGQGESSPVAAVESLVDAINVPDFADASRLAVPGQAALASLAEGASFADVAEALRSGDEEVAANFWSGFAQGTGSFLVGSMTAEDGGTYTESGVVFSIVDITPANGESRRVLLRDVDGYRIDLFASFGSGLADKMVAPVERLLSTQTDDARLILVDLKEIVPSLLAAAGQPDTPSEVSQQLLALVEVITRVT